MTKFHYPSDAELAEGYEEIPGENEPITDKQLNEALSDLYRKMQENMVEYDPEIARITNERFWDMFDPLD